MNKAEELIACLEGEIAKRDARIEAQEAQIKILQSEANSWQSGYDEGRRTGAKPAAPVSEAKAQGVTDEQAAFEAAVAAVNERGWSTSTDLARQIWDAARLNAAPVMPEHPFCEYCGGNDEEPQDHCMDCTRPVQQVSVPDGWKLVPVNATEAILDVLYSNGMDKSDSLLQDIWSAMLAAAPAAPAADAGLVASEWTKDAEEWGGALNYAAWEFINECPEKSALLFNNTKGPLRAAIMKYAELVSANVKDSSHD